MAVVALEDRSPISIPKTVTVRNRCSIEHLAGDHRLLIEDAVASGTAAFGEGLAEIRVQGSIARGEARPGQSDIDLMLVLTSSPTADDQLQCAELSQRLATAHPVVSRVDLDVAWAGHLSEFQRFVLSSDSLSVHGTDALTRPVQRWDRRRLARLVTPDAGAMLDDYRAWADELVLTPDEAEVRFASRVVGKDFLKVLRGLALMRGSPYDVAMPAIRGRVVRMTPEFVPLADALFALYDMPSASPEVVREVIGRIDDANLVAAVSAAI